MVEEKGNGENTPQKMSAKQTAVLLVFGILVAGAITVGVLWQTNSFGYLNQGMTFNVFSEKNTLTNFDDALDYIYISHFSSGILSRTTNVVKWNKPLKIKYDGDPTEKDIESLHKIVDAFNTVEGFPGMEIVDSGENVLVVYANEDNFADLVAPYRDVDQDRDRSVCSQKLKDGILYNATIIIEPNGAQGYKNSVVLHEFFHLVGFYHVEDFRGSIMDLSGPPSSLSEIDVLAFRMLYNPDIPVGMDYYHFEQYYLNADIEDFT